MILTTDYLDGPRHTTNKGVHLPAANVFCLYFNNLWHTDKCDCDILILSSAIVPLPRNETKRVAATSEATTDSFPLSISEAFKSPSVAEGPVVPDSMLPFSS